MRSLPAASVLLCGMLCGALPSACVRSYGEESSLEDGGRGDGGIDATAEASVTFCQARPSASICDDFSGSFSPAWRPRMLSASLSIVTAPAVSPPGALGVLLPVTTSPTYATLDQVVNLSDSVVTFQLDARLQVTGASLGSLARIIRIDSKGQPIILVVDGPRGYLASESTSALRQIGSSFPFPPGQWLALSLLARRTPGVGASFEIAVSGRNVVSDVALTAFDPPFQVSIGGYVQSSTSAIAVTIDDVLLTVP